MKRKADGSQKDIKKARTERQDIDVTDYHAASSVHNFMLNDPILDWFKFKKYPKERRGSSSSESENRFVNFIKNQGIKFEQHVVSIIQSTLEDKNISFVKIANGKEDIMRASKYEETIKAIEDQVGVIYQGVLHGNEDFKAFGSPDFLVRSDVVDFLFDKKIDHVPKRSNGKYNYVIIDIKFCTIKLRADGKFILNESRMPANKAQVMIYNKLLGIAQGNEPRYCYILGRGWKYTKRNENFECSRFNERLGAIDTHDVDSIYNEKIEQAFAWLERVKKDGSKWTYNPPSVPELYPNMCSRYDGYEQKKKIAVEIDEITQIWNCGVKQRELAHKKGIFKISDTRLTSEVMGFPQGTNRTKIIDKMLKFNQGLIGNGKPIIPRYIDNNPYDWQSEVRVEFFLDFEIFSNIFDDFSVMPNVSGPGLDEEIMSIVFMTNLGVSVKTPDGKSRWEYYNFRVPELTNEHEYEMFDKVYNKIEEFCNEFKIKVQNAKIYHWGHIEQTIISKLYSKYEDKHDWEDLCLIDFCKIFQDEQILVKGVYGFGLKTVGKGMIEHGLIHVPAWEDTVVDGLDAMVQAYEIYSNPDINHDVTINNLIKYGHADVRVLERIINYLRRHHVPAGALPASVITTIMTIIDNQ